MRNEMKAKAAMLKQRYRQSRKMYAVLTVLALMVGVGTVWALMQPGYAMGKNLICQQSEHSHINECYQQKLVCELEEDESHQHTNECWITELICRLDEHTHTESCYALAESETTGSEESNPEQTETSTEQTEETQVLPTLPAAKELPKEIPSDYTDIRTAEINKSGYVRIYAKPGTLPADVEVRTALLSEESAEFIESVQRLKDAGVSYEYIKALDISLYNQAGEKVEPEAPVYVEIENAGVIPANADPASIQIQHHKEVVSTKQSEKTEIVLESVLDSNIGLLKRNSGDQSVVAIFPVDRFSVFTITFTGLPDLKIKVQCVDEWEKEIPIKPDDIVINFDHTSGRGYGIDFASPNGTSPKIPGYEFDKKAYYIKDDRYNTQIYGLYYEQSKWYYITQDGPNWNSKQLFNPQPDFNGDNPKDAIRLIYKKVNDIPVEFVNTEEKLLNPSDAPGGKNPGVVRRNGRYVTVSNVDAWPKSPTHYYIGKAYVNERIGENEVVRVISKDNKIYAVTPEQKEIELTEATRLRLIYEPINKDPQPPIDSRVSTRDKGMIINLFNYNSGNTFGPDEKINAGKKLQFVLRNDREEAYNKWTGFDGGIYTGIVDKQLGEDGYPVIQGQSLNYLFDPAMCKADYEANGGKGMILQMHTNLDKLFKLDKDGYYRYDSMTNFATVASNASGNQRLQNTDGSDFIVYKQPALPSINAVGDNPKFLPFNTYAEANSPTANPASNERIKQYHFGMTIETEFVMPTGGLVPDAEGNHTAMRDMIFEFNGDDDVWVFIDGKLALDLGGIHDRYGGTINFRTGEVTTNAPPMEHSGHHQPNLYGIENPDSLTEEQLAEKRDAAGFGRFSQHKLQFFYLERGRGASNCEIHFNLVPVAHGFVVGKRLAHNTNVSTTSHTQYQFQVDVQQPGEEKKPLANAPFLLIRWEPDGDPVNGGKPDGVGSTDANGRFWLKPGQRADFTDVINLKNAGTVEDKKVKIFVNEIMPDGHEKPNVVAWSGKEEEPGTYLVVTDDKGKTRNLVPPMYNTPGYEFHNDKTATKLNRIESNGMVFEQAILTAGLKNEFNWIDFENDLGELASLNITKKALWREDHIPITGVSFPIKIELWDERADKWIPLDDGAPYWLLNQGEAMPGPNDKPNRHVPEKADGQIPIQHGQTIHLKLVPGTKYKVTEILTDEDAGFYTTTYSGTVEKDTDTLTTHYDSQNPKKQIGIGNDHGIKSGAIHHITITNYSDTAVSPKGVFSLTKKVEGKVLPPMNTKFHFELRIKDYRGSDGAAQPVRTIAVYHNTPEGIVRKTESIVFTPDAANADPKAELFLYPGETVVITDLPEGYAMSVQENLSEDQTGNYDVSFQEDKQEAVQGLKLESTVAKITAKQAVQVTCTNISKLEPTSTLQIAKQVYRSDYPDGAPTEEDKQKNFTFTVTLKAPAKFAGGAHSVTIVKDGAERAETLYFEQSGADYTASFSLKHGEMVTIPGLPKRVEAFIQETGHEGYIVLMNKTPGDSITVEVDAESNSPLLVTCVNMIGVEMPETGGIGQLSYYLFGIFALGAAGWLILRRRKSAGRG